MTKTLYANGCSFTAGSELENEAPASALANCTVSDYQLRHAWPQVLGDLAGFDVVINEGLGAGSNARAVRMTLEFVAAYLRGGGDPRRLLVCLGLTDLTRSERHDPDDGWQMLKPRLNGPNAPRDRYSRKCNAVYYRYLHDERAAVTAFIQQVVLLQAQLYRVGVALHLHDAMNSNGTPLRNWSAGVTQADFIDVGGYLSLSRGPDGLMIDEQRCFEPFALAFGVPLGSQGHPLAEGHRRWAAELLRDVQKLSRV